MRNYYNNPRPQLTNTSFLFSCKCMIFYYKSRNLYYYFHFIFGKYSPKYLFEYSGGKAKIVREYTETKWYIWLTKSGYYQGLMQKEKMRIDCEKGAQISILANKIATRWWPNFIIKEPKQISSLSYFSLLSFSRYYQKTGITFNGSFSFT